MLFILEVAQIHNNCDLCGNALYTCVAIVCLQIYSFHMSKPQFRLFASAFHKDWNARVGIRHPSLSVAFPAQVEGSGAGSPSVHTCCHAGRSAGDKEAKVAGPARSHRASPASVRRWRPRSGIVLECYCALNPHQKYDKFQSLNHRSTKSGVHA
jgi:hypothetical protein